MIYTKTTLSNYINLLCKDYAKKNAIVWKTKYRTEIFKYSDLLSYSKKFAVYLLEKNFGKGEKIFIFGANSPGWVITFLGTLLGGMVLVPVDYNSSKEFVTKVINESEPSLFVVSELLKNKLPDNIDKNNVLYLENVFSEIENVDENKIDDYDYFISDNDIAEIIFTSGTTDQPKGVILTHRNIGMNINNASYRMNIKSGTKLLSILPLSHMFEQTAGFFTPLRQGGTVVYIDSMKPSSIKNALLSEKIDIMVAVPAFLTTFKNLILLNISRINKTKQFEKLVKITANYNFSFKRIIFKSIIKKIGGKLKYVMTGGTKLDIETEKFWNNLGIKILQGYGLTETSPVVTCTSFNDTKIGSVGKVLPFQRIKLDNDGEILTAGDNIFHGYLNRPELNKEIFTNGWFRTGDIGHLDEEGDLFIIGRKKNIIVNPAGLNVFPEDIEAKLKENNAVNDCVVVANPDPNFFLKAFITIDEEFKKDRIKSMLDETNSKLETHQKLKEIIIWPAKDFPRTPTRKIIRREVEKIADKFHIDAESNDWEIEINKDVSLGKLITIVKEIIEDDVAKINEETRINEDLGMDSISKLELITKIEVEFLVDLPEEKFYLTNTLKDILTLIDECKNKPDLDVSDNTLPKVLFSRTLKIIQSTVFFLLRFIMLLFFRVRALNKNNISNIQRNFIIVANHASHLDFLTILRVLPPYLRRRTYTAAAFDYFFKNRRINLLSLLFNVFPFYRKDMLRTNLINFGHILDRGKNIIIFPEGTRSRDGKIHEFKDGVGIIVKAMNIPCLPIKLENTYKLWPYNKKVPRQGRVIAKIGKLIRFKPQDSNHYIAEKLYGAIKEL